MGDAETLAWQPKLPFSVVGDLLQRHSTAMGRNPTPASAVSTSGLQDTCRDALSLPATQPFAAGPTETTLARPLPIFFGLISKAGFRKRG